MVVGYGRTLAPGTLPVYSVADEQEALDLIVLACPTNLKGQYIAPELAREQTLENLHAFSLRLDEAHAYLAAHGGCRCHPKETPP